LTRWAAAVQWSDIPFEPPARTLRQFAALWTVAFAGLACWYGLARGDTTTALVLAALAVTVGPLGLAWPRAVRWIFVGWMVAAFPVGWVISRVVLAALFYGVITPVGLVFRLAGRDALQLRRRPAPETYWAPKPEVTDLRRYLSQF
jgi:hypothetical protein